MPRKVFTAGEVLAAADVNSFLMDQAVQTFASSAARSSAIGTATEGMVTWLNDQNALQVYDGTQWNGLAASGGNEVINGAFDVWQRGTSFSHTATSTYTADRFAMINSSYPSGSYSVSQQTFAPGTAPVAGYEGRFFLRYQVSTASGASFQGMVTKLEDVRTFAGQTVTLSFWAKADAARTITPQLGQDFGSGGSSFVTNTGSAINITTSWARYSQTFTLASIAGKTIGTNSCLEVFLRNANAAQTIDIWGVQLEAGPTANTFRRNANSLAGELAACQRYYQRYGGKNVYENMCLGSAATSTIFRGGFKLTTTMRVAPTSLGFASMSITDDFSGFAITNLVLDQAGSDFCSISGDVASGLTQFRPYRMYANNSLSAFVDFSAEL